MGMNKTPLITVVTVCYNAVNNLEKTMLSVLNQTYDNIEYIVIDGGSKDGTVDIIRKYADRLAYWVSEPDKGIYDAMNKGIQVAKGEWINFMNAGDTFYNSTTICSVSFNLSNDVDVVFGDSIMVINGDEFYNPIISSIDNLTKFPIYRHGASFVKSVVHKEYLFDLTKSKEFGFALDYNCIYTLYAKGFVFKQIDLVILKFPLDGVSNNQLMSKLYNYRITKKDRNLKSKILFLLSIIKLYLFSVKWLQSLLRYVYYLFLYYILNDIIAHIPIHSLRIFYFKRFGLKIEYKSYINMSSYILSPSKISIGHHTHINRGCLLDGRGWCFIGNNVSISFNVSLISGGHDIHSKTFNGMYYPIKIEDDVWIGANASILQNVTIGRGSVVASGSIVTKNVAPYTIVGGVPAKPIGKRPKDLDYVCICDSPFL